MRTITAAIIQAFRNRHPRTIGNSSTDGITLFLHGNAIARHNPDGTISITDAGWKTNTTKERLNGFPGVSISQRNRLWYLNDRPEPWDGSWTTIELNA